MKFVIGTVEDYEWAKEQVAKFSLEKICPLLFSWVQPLAPEQQHKSIKKVPAGLTPICRRELVEKIIADALPVRFPGPIAQNHLASGEKRSIDIYDLRLTIYDRQHGTYNQHELWPLHQKFFSSCANMNRATSFL